MTSPSGPIAPHGPLQRVREPWAKWYIGLWVAVMAALVGTIVGGIRFWWWLPIAVVGFGGLEGYGILHPDDPYPPLTQVIREYVPRWLAFTLIYALVGLGAGTWFGFSNRWGMAAIVGLLGWLTTHFDLTFNEPAVEQERVKNRWYADKLGMRRS